MHHSKIFKRPDGSEVNVVVNFIADWSDCSAKWAVQCAVRGYRKRKWESVNVGDDFAYRRLKTWTERNAYATRKALEHATEEQITEVAMELWLKLKPYAKTLGLEVECVESK